MEGPPLPEIQRVLERWVAENEHRIYNEHLTTRGMVICVCTRNRYLLRFPRI